MQSKYKIWISKITYLGLILSILGIWFLFQGMKYSYYINRTKEYYQKNEIHSGKYIECDISKEQLLGNFYSEMNGKIVYSPICGNNVYTHEQRYIVAVSKENNYYVSIDVPDERKKEFQALFSGEISSIHIFGKFKRIKGELSYEEIIKCLDIKSIDDVEKYVSKQYVIQVVEQTSEKKYYYKGVVLILVGIICVLSCFEKNKKA